MLSRPVLVLAALLLTACRFCNPDKPNSCPPGQYCPDTHLCHKLGAKR